jgi:hypothetical protein
MNRAALVAVTTLHRGVVRRMSSKFRIGGTSFCVALQTKTVCLANVTDHPWGPWRRLLGNAQKANLKKRKMPI